MSIVINGSGTITGITAGGLPDATITQAELATGVAGTGPAFSAYLATNQSISVGVFTKVAFNTELYDTASAYDKDTNYRFQPTIAGYYQFNAGLIGIATGTSITICVAAIYKNGSVVLNGTDPRGLTLSSTTSLVSGQVYLNGSTDYVEIYAYIQGTSPNVYGGASATYFQGALIRAA